MSMKLKDLYSTDNIVLSFEVFPPKDDLDGEKADKLTENLIKLKKYNPAFVSVTYGAGGSNADKSYVLIKRFTEELNLVIMPHLTCVNASYENIKVYIDDLKNLGVENILALRGDIPQGMDYSCFDFKYASDLVSFIKTNYNDYFSIAVAGYPEGHIEAKNLDTDLKYLSNKINLGSDAIFTQLFFDNSKFLSYSEKVSLIHPNIPVVAGIMPIVSYKQIERMLTLANVTIPEKLRENVEKYKNNPDDMKKFGVDYVTQQCRNLMDNGVKFFHFYTLNMAKSTSQILDNLSLVTAK